MAPDLDIVINIDFFRKANDDATDNTAHVVFGDDGQGCTNDTQGCQQALKIQAPKSEYHQDDTKGHDEIIYIIDAVDDVVCKFVRYVFTQSIYHDQGRCHNIDDGEQNQKLDYAMEEIKSIM